jgi:4-aminobutyrate aminotransferase-like enzyme
LESSLRRLLVGGKFGAVLVEPVQARGGINVPSGGFLPLLRRLCDETKTLLILDEIYTGFGRTGRWFACEHAGVMPDVICLGKALSGGFPISACVGRVDVMDRAWPRSGGEAIHTSTFLGHPVGCAMALAQLHELGKRGLPERSRRLGGFVQERLRELRIPGGLTARVRGLGLMWGIEFNRADGNPAGEECLRLVKGMLEEGFIVLPEGGDSNVLSFTPPLTITEAQVKAATLALQQLIDLLR